MTMTYRVAKNCCGCAFLCLCIAWDWQQDCVSGNVVDAEGRDRSGRQGYDNATNKASVPHEVIADNATSATDKAAGHNHDLRWTTIRLAQLIPFVGCIFYTSAMFVPYSALVHSRSLSIANVPCTRRPPSSGSVHPGT